MRTVHTGYVLAFKNNYMAQWNGTECKVLKLFSKRQLKNAETIMQDLTTSKDIYLMNLYVLQPLKN